MSRLRSNSCRSSQQKSVLANFIKTTTDEIPNKSQKLESFLNNITSPCKLSSSHGSPDNSSFQSEDEEVRSILLHQTSNKFVIVENKSHSHSRRNSPSIVKNGNIFSDELRSANPPPSFGKFN